MNALAEALPVSLADFDDPSALVYGIGNVGRQDDGLGWAFIDWLETQSLCAKADMHRNYQLYIEDSELISHKRRVLFVDATKEASVTSFRLERAQPRMDISFTSHAVSIPSILATCKQCFDRLPEVWVLAIRGYEWELSVGLTEQARRNLDGAIAHFTRQTSLHFS